MSMERLDGFTADGKGNVIAGSIQDGDVVRIDGRIEQRYYAPVPAAPTPRVLDGVAFNTLCFTVLGGGTSGAQIAAGMATFQAIMDAAAAAGGAAKACVTHYDKSNAFVMADVQTVFFPILVAAGALSQARADAVIAAWPTT